MLASRSALTRFCSCLIALAGLGSALAPAPAQAQQGDSVVLTGTVLDGQGLPLAGALVSARGPVVLEVVVDDSGSYRFESLPAGTYVVRVDAVGYQGVRRTVRLTAAPTTVDFALKPSIALAPLQVVTVRSARTAADLPIKIDLIDAEQVARQQTLAANPTEMLANLIPSYSPGRQKLTSSGESLRGRRPLFLVDGVPQSNPLRDGRRDGFTIDPEVIERIEVLFGANAIQGLGATGGIVNYLTVRPAASGELEQRVSLSGSSGDKFDDDGLGWRGHYLATKRFGSVDAVASVSVERRGLQFDGEGRPIALDNVQGDVADSHSRNLFGKFGWEPAREQRIELTVNDFRLAQDGDFLSVEGDRAAGIPAVSVAGEPEGIEPINDVTTLSLDYTHGRILGGTASGKAYYQDFSALFGGGRFDTFQDPDIAPVGELFDQSENNSEKLGARLTWSRDDLAGDVLGVIGGFDFLRDKTFQRLALTDRNWVPETKFFNYAPFLQLDLRIFESLSVSSGLRWEIATLDVDDFTTLAGNRDDFEPVDVEGGSPSFDEPLFNLGAVLTPVETFRVYGSFSQAFTMPDVGRVLRGISEEGTAVEEFLDLQPVKTDNIEFGGTYGVERLHLGLTYFRSTSDLGSRLVPNADGIFEVRREPTRTSGWELTGAIDVAEELAVGLGYSILEGKFDGDGDGDEESDLGAADIGPNRLNLSADLYPDTPISGRLQLFHFFDRTFRDGGGVETASFDGYTTIDASASVDVGRGTTLSLSVANLLDEQYISYFGQAATTRNDRFFAGRGRTLTLRAETRF